MWRRPVGVRLSRLCSTSLSRQEPSGVGVAAEPNGDRVQTLLNNLAGMELKKVMSKRKEPLIPPHYQLMTLEQLQQSQEKARESAKAMLQVSPILPERSPCGEVIEVDENLAGAITHRMIFTETSQYKENLLRSIVVRETDGVLRQATWEERDKMCQVFFPTLGRKMWLPKALSEEILPFTLDRMLHLNALELVDVQCDPQSYDYHRVHRYVYEDIEKRKCYDLLRSTRYFGSMVWHLLTCSDAPPRIYGLLRDMLQRQLFTNAAELVHLFMLCFPEGDVSVKLRLATDENLIKEFCEVSNFLDILSLIEPSRVKSDSSISMS